LDVLAAPAKEPALAPAVGVVPACPGQVHEVVNAHLGRVAAVKAFPLDRPQHEGMGVPEKEVGERVELTGVLSC
jgi:hypothetical protein